jgi:hypothetical protein
LGLLFSKPEARQIKRCFLSTFQTQTVRGQAKAWHMGVVIARGKIFIFDFLEKNPEVYALGYVNCHRGSRK